MADIAIKQHPLLNRLPDLPERPGIYLFKNLDTKVLYVGKAINLKSRVKSYFYNFSSLTPAKQKMILSAVQLDYILVSDETEALLLENKYIKSYRPPYNVIWKDDKNYLYLMIDWSEAYPRLQTARKLEPLNNPKNKLTKKSKEFFGPYPSATAVRQTIKVLHRLFPFRTCDRDLTKIPNGKICLLYHLGQCLGPCEAKCSPKEYQTMMQQLATFLRGDIKPLIAAIEVDMKHAAQNKNFETAAKLRDQKKSLALFTGHQAIIEKRGLSADILNLSRSPLNKQEAVISQLQIRYGQINRREQWILSQVQDESDAELLETFIAQFYATVPENSKPKEVLTPIKLNLPENITALGLKVRAATRGEKQKLIALGQDNAEIFWTRERPEIRELRQPQVAVNLLREELINAGVPIPEENKLTRIECYDISNNQGNFSVGSQVVFIHGKASKKDYRHYAIRGLEGPNDFAMHAQMMSRRLAHSYGDLSQVPNKPVWDKPDLIVIDGGAGQLSAVLPLIRAADKNIPVIGLAKQFEEIYLPTDLPLKQHVINLGLDHPAIYLLQQLRDEAHRFGITFYRSKHQKATIKSAFDDIRGLGPKKKKLLRTKYGSPRRAAQAPTSELAALIGEKLAQTIQQQFGT